MKGKELPTLYQQYIHMSRYSRWNDAEGRRETWEETVDRYINFFKDHLGDQVAEDDRIWGKLRKAILNLEVMPSMRALMTAGKALRKDHTAAYNCAFLVIDHPNKFSELMHVLLCGTGVGYSVERQYINELPTVAEEFHTTDTVLQVADTKTGWCRSFKELIGLLYSGQVPSWDLTKIRPAGAPLKTFGGRASGPDPLEQLFNFAVTTFRAASGRRLNSLEVHDLCCKVADVVVVGGVRRSALISLSNLTDQRMRNAKQGEFYHTHPHRSLANNSVCYTEKPDIGIFMEEWQALYRSQTGERGIFNRAAVQQECPERRDADKVIGTNPCSEILLRDRQFCNLTEIVARPGDTLEDLLEKARLAAILGTMQATLTDFRFLSRKWKENCEAEALLGVSITGIRDHLGLSGEFTGQDLAKLCLKVRATNRKWAKILGIEPAAATTCVKPSGTVSQLVNSASGIHDRFAPFYIRRVRQDIKDPITDVLIAAGVPHEPDTVNPAAMVFSFPVKSPAGRRRERSAIQQLEEWLWIDSFWCEHKPSITVYVEEDEWMEVGAWVYKHFDSMSGVSFLPKVNHVYQQAPYEEITEEEYERLAGEMPESIDWAKELSLLEDEDGTINYKELACSGGQCDI